MVRSAEAVEKEKGGVLQVEGGPWREAGEGSNKLTKIPMIPSQNYKTNPKIHTEAQKT